MRLRRSPPCPLSLPHASDGASPLVAGCAAVFFDFDVPDWPADPEQLMGALLSKRSQSFGGYGLSIGYGTFQSDQYWMNKKIKEAKAYSKKMRKSSEEN